MNIQESEFDLCNKGRRAAENGDWKTAADFYLKALTPENNNHFILINYLESLVNSENWEIILFAVSSFRGEVEDDACQARVDLFEGIAYVMTERKGQGEALLKKAHRYPCAESFNYLGINAFLREKYVEALSLFEKSVDLKSDYFEAWFNLVDTCGELGLKEKEKSARQKMRNFLC